MTRLLHTLVLQPEELRELTGYRSAARQLDELRRQGYHRARRAPISGRVILERAHYEAVSSGSAPQHSQAPSLRPALR